MQFLLFDVSATLVFLLGYLAVVTLLRRRALPVPAVTRAPRPAERPAARRAGPEPSETRKEPAARQCRREWPRLIHPR